MLVPLHHSLITSFAYYQASEMLKEKIILINKINTYSHEINSQILKHTLKQELNNPVLFEFLKSCVSIYYLSCPLSSVQNQKLQQ